MYWFCHTSTCIHHKSNILWVKKMWYLHRMEYYSAIRKKERMLFAMTWMDLEVVIRSEVKSQRETQTYKQYMWKLKKSYKRTYLQNRNRVTDVENNLMVISGERGGGINWEVGIHIWACGLSSFSCVRLLVILWTLAHQATLSMGFSRQEYWSGLLPGSSPGGSRESEAGTASARIRKQLLN